MAEKVLTLTRQRGVFKGQITRLATYLEDADSKDNLEYQVKLDNLKKVQEKLENLKLQFIETVEDDDELNNHLGLITDIEEEAEKLEVRIKKFLLLNNSLSNNEKQCLTDINLNESVNIKLPDIPLPKFSGNYQDWYTFKDQFITLIDSNNKLNDTQKLYYLKSTLSGKALDVISLDDTYSSLFKALTDRFENKRFIVDSHMNEILNMENSSQDAAKNLRMIVDNSQKQIRALKSIGLELNQFSEIMLINIILKKLDRETKKQFELSLTSTELPDWENFIEFLNKRCLVLENLQNSVPINKLKQTYGDKNPKFKSLLVKGNSANSCIFCKSNHFIYKCDKFLNLSESERYCTVKKLNLCLNCLSPKHRIAQCPSKYSCSLCSKKHNTLLHRDDYTGGKTEASGNISSECKQTNKVDGDSSCTEQLEANVSKSLCSEISFSRKKENKVLLATCIIYVENSFGERIPARTILDSGSESCFMTAEFSDLLGIKKNKLNIYVSGINGNKTNIKTKLRANISNKEMSFQRSVEFLITRKITELVPSQNINIKNLKLPSNINLADPNFEKSSKIDILVGAELFYEILETEKQKISQLLFQKTVFGYIVSGTVQQECYQKFCGFIQQTNSLEENIQNFWKIESIDEESCSVSDEDQYCEKHFLETYHRDDTGRFIVNMPLKSDADNLGESKQIAERRLSQLWTRLEKMPAMKDLYCQFMSEYEDLNHMRKVTKEEVGKCYYLPHHGIFRPEKSSSRLRAVFNASSPTTNGKSLNDILFKGPVKEDLYEIMIRFRKHKYVFLADIEKMYRQILITDDQRKLLRILWKKDANLPTEIYELNTVTYGTTCAPFLATRTLKQLALLETDKFPEASEILLNDCYMDDIISGEDNLDTAKVLQYQLIELLKSAGMHLHKWNANHSSLLQNVSKENLEGYTFSENETKALGVIWNPTLDIFTFKVKIEPQENLTKRTILSDIARIFDPLGLIGPIITKAKIFMQELWKLKLDWNDPIPNSIAQTWFHFTKSLKDIENLSINRYILTPNAEKLVLHGFADASSLAFGAAVYIQSFHNSKISCNLIGSKSQIAPLKTVTIPRLELSACLLLSKLVIRIIKALKLVIHEVYLYTDSQIALAWLQTPPWKLKTFVGNRVAKIQSYTQNYHWKFVPSKINPADLISRGIDATELANNKLWFHGPDFLSSQTSFPDLEHSSLTPADDELILKEMKDIPTDLKYKETMNNPNEFCMTLVQSSSTDFYFNLFSLTNNFLKLIRICSFIFRFLYNCKKPEDKRAGPISIEELKKSENFLIKQVQYVHFREELNSMQKDKKISGNSKLKFFNPFLDSENVIRVGGRLQNANLSYNRKYPILLPHNHKLSELIMEHFHKKYFHVGPQALLHHVRQNYWIINGRSLARKIVHKCITCFKSKPIEANQIMGNLPSERVNPCPPFQICGIDFCGPFEIKYKNQRKGSYNKVYVALFVCFATKAIHLEIVTDLKSESFIATLKRFFARRGKSSTIVTDNGPTFVGTNTELKKLYAMVISPDDALTNYLASESVKWKFIPARSPNFGGLWEAGVKSFKYHLKRTLGNSHVTLEEFLTIITEIEGILNSRPLQPLSSDPNEIEVLTPGHFLIGRPIISLPEPDITHIKENRLSSWQKITKITQILWKKWQRDYLNYLQQRNKWFIEKENLKEGCMVILKDDNLPPRRWALGRVLKIIYGPDNKVRVLQIKTITGIVTRGISKVCPLPIDCNV